ncbi:hypothetical protein ElyMa_002349400 [Elysia marginata]|uniref:Uncharacterized protein n=1 Tax=Elysia marginata TaxID=1093978 RepID=A0AAV4G9Y0_9GAST|nr:hypothetical protein ElyMa_002349400 [Elysia marginata]
MLASGQGTKQTSGNSPPTVGPDLVVFLLVNHTFSKKPAPCNLPKTMRRINEENLRTKLSRHANEMNANKRATVEAFRPDFGNLRIKAGFPTNVKSSCALVQASYWPGWQALSVGMPG